MTSQGCALSWLFVGLVHLARVGSLTTAYSRIVRDKVEGTPNRERNDTRQARVANYCPSRVFQQYQHGRMDAGVSWALEGVAKSDVNIIPGRYGNICETATTDHDQPRQQCDIEVSIGDEVGRKFFHTRLALSR